MCEYQYNTYNTWVCLGPLTYSTYVVDLHDRQEGGVTVRYGACDMTPYTMIIIVYLKRFAIKYTILCMALPSHIIHMWSLYSDV